MMADFAALGGKTFEPINNPKLLAMSRSFAVLFEIAQTMRGIEDGSKRGFPNKAGADALGLMVVRMVQHGGSRQILTDLQVMAKAVGCELVPMAEADKAEN